MKTATTPDQAISAICEALDHAAGQYLSDTPAGVARWLRGEARPWTMDRDERDLMLAVLTDITEETDDTTTLAALAALTAGFRRVAC
jgi:hypothetical protein